MANYSLEVKISVTATHVSAKIVRHDIWDSKPVKTILTRRVSIPGVDTRRLEEDLVADVQALLKWHRSSMRLF